MARLQWTFALILIVLPILATVITAFRVRDLPKSSDVKKPKCHDCEVNDDKIERKFHSVKLESAKHSYEELKKSVREKQQLIKQKAQFSKIHEDDDDDEEEDDAELSKEIIGRKIKKISDIKTYTPGINKQKNLMITKKVLNDDHNDDDDDDEDDDEDDDDDDDDDEPISSQTASGHIKKEKPNTKEIKQATRTKQKQNIPIIKEKIEEKTKLQKRDGDMKISAKLDVFTNIKRNEQPKQLKIKPPMIRFSSDDDDDDDDDDNDDDDDSKGNGDDANEKQDNFEHQTKAHITKNILKDSGDSSNADTDIEVQKKANYKKPRAASHISNDLEDKHKSDDKNKDHQEKENNSNDEKHPVKETSSNEKSKKEPEKVQKDKHETKKTSDDRRSEGQSIESKKNKKPKSDNKNDNTLPNKEKISKELEIDEEDLVAKIESNIKHVTDALYRRNLLQSEFEDFYAFYPTFAPNFSRIHNSECRRHGQILLRQLRGTKLWALNMLDATAKIPSGILQGNGIQLGDFDQCLGSRARVQLDSGSVVKVQGKYCLAQLDLKVEHPELEASVHLAQAKNLIRSRIDDPGHFVPRFSTLSWGVCVPSACEPEDVEVILKDALKHYQHTSGVVIKVKVDESDCQTGEDDWWDSWLELPTILTLSFYSAIILLIVIATLQDFLARRKSNEELTENEADENAECDQKEPAEKREEEEKKQGDGFISGFSLYRTLSKLTAPGTTDDISCIHGIRGLATIALLIAHKFLPVAITPYTNRLKITETVSSPLWSWCRAGWMYTDCFLLLSGTLAAHRISSDSESSAFRRLFSRYLRLTPALLAVVLFYAYVWDNISAGPMWGSLVSKNAKVCQEGWWWNMLYVQNYFGFEEMCAPQTHQLALDMQLTIFGSILVWLLQVKRGMSLLILPGLHALTAYLRYTAAYEHRLTLLAYHGVSVSQLYRTARLSYSSAAHRATPYLVGISLGLALQKHRDHNKLVIILGWMTSLSLWGAVWWAGFDSGATQYRYNASFAAQYVALAPVASALAIAWVIYAVHNGCSDYLSRFLSSRPLVLISRLSYALYLVQFIVFFTNAATTRTSSEFSLISLINAQETTMILLASTILTLTFVIPMQSLHKLFTFSFISEVQEESQEAVDENKSGKEEPETEPNVEEADDITEVPQKSRLHLVAHREVLEEIPEVEVEYETQREMNEGLEEILEEEEDEVIEEDLDEEEVEERADDGIDGTVDDEDLEIIEEEEGGEDDFWADREEFIPRRTYSRQNDEDRELDEWEFTANGSGRSGAQSRYSR